METIKTCFKCNLTKPTHEFYKHIGMADGHLNKCIVCTKKDEKERYHKKSLDPEYRQKERKRGRNKYHALYALIRQNKSNVASKDYKSRYPEKVLARSIVNKSAKTKHGHHNHHWSYRTDHASDIIELTIKEHAKAHRFLIYDQERMMYRTLTGILLDTKERHLSYILDVIKNQED